MPGCKPGCVSSFSGTDRQKWNYVKSLYLRNYNIDENGDRVDSFNETRFLEMFENDRSEWLNTNPTKPFERWLQWRFDIGTALTGNLPQYKRKDHTGHCWMPCPYSTDSSDTRSDVMWDVWGDPVLSKVDHGDAYMQTDSRGNVWGWTCTYSGCSYLLDSGIEYFYK